MIAATLALMLWASHGAGADTPVEALSYGAGGCGKLVGGVALPCRGKNFEAFADTACALGRNYLHPLVQPQDERAHKARTMVRVRIENKRCARLPISNHSVGLGTAEVLLWANEVEGIKEQLLETEPELIAVAQRTLAKKLVGESVEALGGSFSLKDVEAAIANDSNATVKAAYEKVLATTALSLEGVFQEQNGRDIKPLSKFEVIGKGQPSPYLENELRNQQVIRSYLSGNKQ